MRLKINKPRTRWGPETVTITRIKTVDLIRLLEAAKKGVDEFQIDKEELIDLVVAIEEVLDRKDSADRFQLVRASIRTG